MRHRRVGRDGDGGRGTKGTAAPPRESVAWRGLSVWQPLATLATCGRVDRLRMAWGTSYRGVILVHAANVWDADIRRICNSRPWRDVLTGIGYGRSNPLPVGGFVGAIKIDDCILINEYNDDEIIDDKGELNFFRGNRWQLRYDWIIGESRALPVPIRSKGTREIRVPGIAIFPVPVEVGAEVKARSNPVRVDPIEWPEDSGTMVDIASLYHKALSHANHSDPMGGE